MGKTILLADDSLTIQKVVELTFSDTDYDIITTSGGDELLERLPSSGADIVICDTIMPGTDGYAVCQAIKSESATLHIPVILMTGTFEPFDRDRALAAGCSEIITKPFEAKNLVETVERLISDHSATAPAAEPFEGSVAPPAFSGADAPPDLPPSAAAVPDPDQVVSDFGTMLSPPPEAVSEVAVADSGEELDFTSSGFAEMEAAGAKSEAVPDVTPENGLDFDPSTSEEPEVEELEAAKDPEPESTQPISAVDVAKAADLFSATAPEILTQADEEEVEPAVEEPAAPEPEPLEAPAAESGFPELTDVEVHPPVEYSADTDPVVDAAPEPSILIQQDDIIEDLTDAPGGQLSDADIDRIARRVVELAADRLEKVAWDVIPDMAEIIVRERLRELEDEIESVAGVTEPN